ncbi:MucBP domain-containing protein [Lacticaseibacillus daqingensis]|uniref:MucBP domain-containing protein n=1 Tax=Lacticaseibacillus daqingensis TaxID=2486014 RepID=UPI000F7BA10A|nr:MucBP domain-containing protein [Lacticaseibacillus daqingensis]
MTVVYYAQDQTRDLKPPLQLTGHPGAALTLVPPIIEGHELVAVVGYLSTFPATNQTVICRYQPRVAAPVLVYHRDTHGRLLAPPALLVGKLHAHFTPAPLPALIEQLTATPALGQFTELSQRITFTYTVDPLTHGKPPTAAYIELLTTKAAFAQPNLTTPLTTALPAHTIWRVFDLARTPDGTVWLNIGGSQWLTAQDTRPQAHGPFQLPAAPLRLPAANIAYTMQATRYSATVAGGAAGVTQWQAPYEAPLDERLETGTQVFVTHTATTRTGSTWARLANGHYVLVQYLN